MAEDATPHDARAKVWDLIGRFQAAMLVTKSQNGALSGRPMSHIVKADEGLVYILTEQTTESAHAIEADPAALSDIGGQQAICLAFRSWLRFDRSRAD